MAPCSVTSTFNGKLTNMERDFSVRVNMFTYKHQKSPDVYLSLKRKRDVQDGLNHAARNKFERFRGFLEKISRFEFDFRRRGFF